MCLIVIQFGRNNHLAIFEPNFFCICAMYL